MHNFDKSRLFERYPSLRLIEADLIAALQVLIESYEESGKLLVMGNGGSSADAEHFCGELTKSFLFKRKLTSDQRWAYDQIDSSLAENLENGLPAMSLGVAHSGISAFINDVDATYMYAQQVHVFAQKQDVVFAISTSGNSKNVIEGLKVAKAKRVKSIALTGEKVSLCEEFADITLKAPSSVTHEIQELHLPIYHAICIELEEHFFGKNKG